MSLLTSLVGIGLNKYLGGKDSDEGAGASFKDIELGNKRREAVRSAEQVRMDSANVTKGGVAAHKAVGDRIFQSIYQDAYRGADNAVNLVVQQAINENKAKSVIRQIKYDFGSETDAAPRLKRK